MISLSMKLLSVTTEQRININLELTDNWNIMKHIAEVTDISTDWC